MNPREKRLAAIFGVGVGLIVLYFGINKGFIEKIRTERAKQATSKRKLDEIAALERRKNMLGERWKEDVARTLSFDETIAKSRLDVELKRIAAAHGFDRPSVKSGSAMRIGKNTIKAKADIITVTGDYKNVLAFVHDLYKAPFLCQVTSIGLTPVGGPMARNLVKLDLLIETPVLPEKFRGVELGPVATMPESPDSPMEPFRDNLAPPSYFAVLKERNILREYLPPPTNIIVIDNQDRKMVGVKADFIWDDKVETHLTKGVEGKKQLQLEGQGDTVEVTIAYADGSTAGPTRHSFTASGPWVLKTESRTPAPPPEYVNLAVNNQNAEDVFVSLVITTPEGKQVKPPPMLIEASKTVEVGEWNAKQIQVSAHYKSNKPAPGGNYMPADAQQVLMIPPEPEEVIAEVHHDPTDAPADDRYTVSGLWTYRDVQEMIVNSAEGRKVITTDDDGAVDGGTLLAVHPLGGIVMMPSGHYYLYPLGKRFGQRVLLDAGGEEELASAIDAWSRQ